MITNTPLRRPLRLLVVTSVTIAVGIGSIQTTTATAQAPQAYKATPSFTKQWKKAKRSFAKCQYPPSWKTYKAIRKRGTRLADVVQRFKFYDGLATSAYMSGYKQTAKRYARQAGKLDKQITTDQRARVQVEIRHLSGILYDEYSHWCSWQANQ